MKTKIVFGGLIVSVLVSILFLKQGNNEEYTPSELAEIEYKNKRENRLNGYHKSDKPDQFARFNEMIRTKDGDDKPRYSHNYKTREFLKAKEQLAQLNLNQKNSRLADIGWIERGPGNVPGRTRGLIVFPSDPNSNTWLAGSVGGGIWKTADAGATWENKTPDFPNLGTTTLVMSESDNNIIYAGTGEQYADYIAINGDGMFKSIDAGETWQQISSTIDSDDFRNINRLIVDPTNPDIIVVATSNSWWGGVGTQSRIMRSTDGGTSWTKVFETGNDIDHIVAAPSDFNIQYASINRGGILKSIDGGVTWVNKSSGISTSGRMELAVANNDANLVYVSAEGSQSSEGSDLFLTQDGAENWALVINAIGTNPDFLGGQGFYDNTIAVHPYDDNTVYVGGVDIFKFIITGSIVDGDLKVLGAEEDGTDAFMDFVIFTESNFTNGSVAILTNEGTDITPEEFVSVEIRFGSGMSQKAHRFTVPDGSTSGVAIANYSYADYTDVPFEVWDITNNKQLMVSYRDQENNGVFNLNDGTEEGRAISREYLFINAVDYDPVNPDSDIAQAGGRAFRQMYFFWPLQVIGTTWDGNNLPDSKLVVNYGLGLEIERDVTSVADAYSNHGGPNQFNQGSDYSSSNITGPHPDHHGLYMVKVDEGAETFKILNTSDGGVYSTNTATDPGESQGDWVFAGNGYNTTQFYGVDKKNGENEYFGGTQDNGTWKSPSGEDASSTTHYTRQLTGDGFEVVWNYSDTDEMLGTIYYNDVRKTTNGGASWSSAVSGLGNTSQGDAPFITKLANVKSDPDVVYAVGSDGVWKTTDFASSWTGTTIGDELWNYTGFADVDISLANNSIVWAGGGMSSTRSLFVSADKGDTFEPTSNYDRGLGVITGMASHPTDENTFFAIFSFFGNPKILKTTDLGASWDDISGFGLSGDVSVNGFPDVATYCMLVRPDNTDIYWAGTEIGLIESTDAGVTWNLADNGIPNVSIWDMKVVNDQVVVGTHGRGIWSVTIPELLHSQSTITSTQYLGQQTLQVTADITANFDKVEVYVDDQLAATENNVTKGNLTIEATKLTEEASEVYVIAYLGSASYKSPTATSVVADFKPILTSLVSNTASELLFDVEINENYTKLELYLDDELATTVNSVTIGSNEITVSDLDGGKLYVGYVMGYLDGVGYKSTTINTNVIAGFLSYFYDENMKVYPNPSVNELTLEISSIEDVSNSKIELFDMSGKRISAIPYTVEGDIIKVDVSKYKRGMYILNVQNKNEVYTQKVNLVR